MFVGGALAAALGTLIGFLGFRFGLRGFYFVLLTVAFAEICRIIASNTDAIGGAVGYYITFTGDPRQFPVPGCAHVLLRRAGSHAGGDGRGGVAFAPALRRVPSARSARTRARARRSASTPSATRCSR